MNKRMMRLLALIFGMVFLFGEAFSQTSPNKYWVRFADKNNSPFSLSNPTAFLSEKCIARREKFSIGYNDLDIPVNQQYIDGVLASGCQLHNRSKWFNAITIITTDPTILTTIVELQYVLEVKSMRDLPPSVGFNKYAIEDGRSIQDAQDVCNDAGEYGQSFRQIEMMNGHLLHACGFNGKEVDIAQFDAGWNKADNLPVFDLLRSEGRLKMERDFVFEPHDNIYSLNSHGTFVLSTMTGFIPGEILGTGYGANYYLFRTEDPTGENLAEEDNWVAAAEMSDSLGIDIINSSLGYSRFDNAATDHTYTDMDGNTTRAAIAGDIAASKGILVINSAGNSGNNSWHYITTPSDGDSVLCIGAVDANREHAIFSSFGPSSDGDVKPNVSAMGQAAAYAALDSTVKTGNGTSFSSPILAGLASCLVQAFPDKSNMQISHAIEQSAHLYNNPNDSLGYGIPDFWKAFMLLQENGNTVGEMNAQVFPNPCTDHLNITIRNSGACKVDYEIYDGAGRKVFDGNSSIASGDAGVVHLDYALKNVSAGNYTIHLSFAGEHSVLHFEKIKN